MAAAHTVTVYIEPEVRQVTLNTGTYWWSYRMNKPWLRCGKGELFVGLSLGKGRVS